uniref:Uncharacterized protein n=1 Tax=Anguilla anguilla TaxID=7936 RepID=A0A0E9TYD1_ANGAN
MLHGTKAIKIVTATEKLNALSK